MKHAKHQQQPFIYPIDGEQYDAQAMPSVPTTTFIQSDFTPQPESSFSSSFSPLSPPDSPNGQRKPSDTSSSGDQESSPTLNSPIKKAHSSVERAYRERLNDKIDALASILFFDSSLRLTANGTVKPSKCLVISRAKERIEQLDSQNFALRYSVEALRQQMAVLNHLLVIAKSGNTVVGDGSFNGFPS